LEELVVTEVLSKFFGDVQALRGLDLEVPKGVSGFVGPNGAGKTTTINILLGLLKPDGGKASVFGLDSWRDSFRIRQRLGVLHEKPAYPSNFTGRRYLEHVAMIYSLSEPKRAAEEVLKEVGLQEAKEKTIKAYSAGMIQRLGLAQALISNPELAILDEPTANLDPMGRIEFLEKIKEMQRSQGVNFFISTHILPELEKVCGWVSIINEGVIVDQGSMQSLADKYSVNVFRIDVSRPELFVERLRQTGTVEKTWTEDRIVYCKVKDAKFYSEVPRLASELGLELRSLQPLRNTLEEIFRTVVGGEAA
jgi:ABC-2 type transport system ATP-binding protein